MNQHHPALTNSERQRRHRQRERAGLITLRVDVHEVGLADALVAGGLLDPARVDDRAAIARAVERQLALLERFPR